MLKIKDNVDLKELEKFGFEKLENNFKKHKYSWKRDLGRNCYYELYINRNNELHISMVANWNYEITIVHRLQDKIYDLIKADLVEKVDD